SPGRLRGQLSGSGRSTPGSGIELHPKDLHAGPHRVPRPCHGRLRTTVRWQGSASARGLPDEGGEKQERRYTPQPQDHGSVTAPAPTLIESSSTFRAAPEGGLTSWLCASTPAAACASRESGRNAQTRPRAASYARPAGSDLSTPREPSPSPAPSRGAA